RRGWAACGGRSPEEGLPPRAPLPPRPPGRPPPCTGRGSCAPSVLKSPSLPRSSTARTPMRRDRIVNAYTLPRTPGRETLRMRAFVDALAAAGWREGQEIAIDLIDAESDAEARAAAERLVADGADV